MPLIKELYLGDGLYASFDGSQIRLRAPRGMTEADDHVVYLDQSTFNALVLYVERLKKEQAGETG